MGGGGGTRSIFGKRCVTELLKVWPCLGHHPQCYYPSRTNDIMNAILFLSHLLAIAVQKINVIVFAFVYV